MKIFKYLLLVLIALFVTSCCWNFPLCKEQEREIFYAQVDEFLESAE